MEDYYSILGLEKTASQAEIRAAYRKLAQQWHPDKEGGDEATFKKVGKAYETLSNEEKRKAYDEGGCADPGERTPHSAAIQGLDALIERFGPMDVNLIEAIRREIKNAQVGPRKAEDEARRNLIKLEKRLQVLIFKGKGENVLAMLLNRQIVKTKAAREQHQFALDALDEMLKILKDFEDQGRYGGGQDINKEFLTALKAAGFGTPFGGV